ncbi:WD40-repeat-containing domain protein [Scleroderma citrinum]
MALFPWDYHSIETLWSGAMNQPEIRKGWEPMVDSWLGAIIIGGTDAVAVWPAKGSVGGFCLRIPGNGASQGRFSAVAWALSNEAPLEPLMICSRGSILYVLNVNKKQVVSQLRGHGGEITSIAVHPSFPYLVCTCSKDFSARIYDLTMPPRDRPNNPHWPPSTLPSLGGAPHGLQPSEPEGIGIGRCVIVLCGGPSGGHDAAVLGAAFHPSYPLIATCGMDRAVKIWRLPRMSFDKLAREDKPLFSSTRIHKARILSVNWLSLDVLATSSAPALMRSNNNPDDLYFEDGTFAIWRWLGFDRFFPDDRPKPAKVMRGCASDYQESSSFKILSVVSTPRSTRHLHIAQTHTNDYVIAVTLPDRMCFHNVSNLEPRKPPGFPLDQESVNSLKSKLHLDDEDDEELSPGPTTNAQSLPLGGWREIFVPNLTGDTLQACTIGFYGLLLCILDNKGRVWIWTDTTE